MRSLSTGPTRSALLTGCAAFAFFALAWKFTGTFSLGLSLALAAFMGIIVTMTHVGLARTRHGGAGR